jgi:hypothetical protein
MLDAAISSSFLSMIPGGGVLGVASLRVFRVVRDVRLAMLVRVCRGFDSHWPTTLLFAHFSLAEKKRLQANFFWFVDGVRVGCIRTWFPVIC